MVYGRPLARRELDRRHAAHARVERKSLRSQGAKIERTRSTFDEAITTVAIRGEAEVGERDPVRAGHVQRRRWIVSPAPF